MSNEKFLYTTKPFHEIKILSILKKKKKIFLVKLII